jgi:hypothetical protein
VPDRVGTSSGETSEPLTYEQAEALAEDLLTVSDTICRKNIQAVQDAVRGEYHRLIVEEMKKTPDLPPDKARAEAEWRLRGQLRQLRERVLVYGIQQEEIRRERDRKILEWVKSRLASSERSAIREGPQGE